MRAHDTTIPLSKVPAQCGPVGSPRPAMWRAPKPGPRIPPRLPYSSTEESLDSHETVSTARSRVSCRSATSLRNVMLSDDSDDSPRRSNSPGTATLNSVCSHKASNPQEGANAFGFPAPILSIERPATPPDWHAGATVSVPPSDLLHLALPDTLRVLNAIYPEKPGAATPASPGPALSGRYQPGAAAASDPPPALPDPASMRDAAPLADLGPASIPDAVPLPEPEARRSSAPLRRRPRTGFHRGPFALACPPTDSPHGPMIALPTKPYELPDLPQYLDGTRPSPRLPPRADGAERAAAVPRGLSPKRPVQFLCPHPRLSQPQECPVELRSIGLPVERTPRASSPMEGAVSVDDLDCDPLPLPDPMNIVARPSSRARGVRDHRGPNPLVLSSRSARSLFPAPPGRRRRLSPGSAQVRAAAATDDSGAR